MEAAKIRKGISWLIAGLLAVGFGLAAAGKLSGVAIPMFEAWGYPSWFALLIGVLELSGAIALLVPKTSRAAALGLGVIMIGAAVTHATHNEIAQVARPGIFLALLTALFFLRSPRK